ncbi:MAG: hypothetical protein WC241_00250 [Candidatus Paceibacterota bacterium]|jgi:hypothetical protein
MGQLKELINNQFIYMIFKTIAGLINIALVFLFYTMPIWILLLILNIKYKKKNTVIITNNEVKEANIIVSVNNEVKKDGLFNFVFNKNKAILFNSIIILILLFLGYYFALHASCEGLGCLVSGLLLVPFILSFIVIGIILIVRLISGIVEFYYPNQKKFIIPKYIKTIIYILIAVYFIYGFLGYIF